MFEIIDEKCTPSRGSKYSACVDLRSREDVVIDIGSTVLIPLGVKLDMEELYLNWYRNTDQNRNRPSWSNFKLSHYFQLMLRSSLSKHLVITGGVGVIDCDYEGEIMIRVHNLTSMKGAKIDKGQRIAQITLMEHKSYLMGYETDEIRDGGFGSTGSK